MSNEMKQFLLLMLGALAIGFGVFFTLGSIIMVFIADTPEAMTSYAMYVIFFLIILLFGRRLFKLGKSIKLILVLGLFLGMSSCAPTTGIKVCKSVKIKQNAGCKVVHEPRRLKY